MDRHFIGILILYIVRFSPVASQWGEFLLDFPQTTEDCELECDKSCLAFLKDEVGCKVCACDPDVEYLDDMKLDEAMKAFLAYEFNTDDEFNPKKEKSNNRGGKNNERKKREAAPDYLRWDVNLNSDNKWIIPFTIDATISPGVEAIIRESIAEYEAYVCLDFVERTTETDYILFRDDGSPACWSYIGRTSQQPNEVQLSGQYCNNRGTVIHEMMHALGFFHEHQRPDRDTSVDIIWDNILPGFESNFYALTNLEDLGVPYDTNSIMEYSPRAFSKNGLDTIVMKNGAVMHTQRGDLVQTDVDQLWAMYKCVGEPIKIAGEETTTTAAVVEIAQQQAGVCADQLSTCATLKTQKACLAIPSVMKIKCPVTCNLCDCEDVASNCTAMASSGHCTNAATINNMIANCPLTCGLCECRDKGDCEKWTTIGTCSNGDGPITDACIP